MMRLEEKKQVDFEGHARTLVEVASYYKLLKISGIALGVLSTCAWASTTDCKYALGLLAGSACYLVGTYAQGLCYLFTGLAVIGDVVQKVETSYNDGLSRSKKKAAHM